jgi:hypothetical protein
MTERKSAAIETDNSPDRVAELLHKYCSRESQTMIAYGANSQVLGGT